MAAQYLVPLDSNFDAPENFQIPVFFPVSFYATTSYFWAYVLRGLVMRIWGSFLLELRFAARVTLN